MEPTTTRQSVAPPCSIGRISASPAEASPPEQVARPARQVDDAEAAVPEQGAVVTVKSGAVRPDCATTFGGASSAAASASTG